MKVFRKLSNEQLGRFLLDDDRLFELHHDFEDVPESKLNIASCEFISAVTKRMRQIWACFNQEESKPQNPTVFQLKPKIRVILVKTHHYQQMMDECVCF